MTPSPTPTHLREVHDHVLALHRALLRAEQEAWERLNGRHLNNAELLEMTIADPWFAWLQPLTALLLLLDDAMAARGDDPEATATAALRAARLLLHPDEDGSDFQQRYFEFVQRTPDVAVAHGAALRTLGAGPEGE